MTHDAAAEGQELVCHAGEQEWLVSWHGPAVAPAGQRHGAAGICFSSANEIVLVSADGQRWELPAGRPEVDESWEETLRREVLEESCAVVTRARLLGFSRGRCTLGQEHGLVLVRSLWRAEVALQPWAPVFEMSYRRVVPAGEVLEQLTIGPGYLPIYQRALAESLHD